MSSQKDRLAVALTDESPGEALYALAVNLRLEGMSQVDLYRLYAEWQRFADEDHPAYDEVLDVMDLIWGGAYARGGALYETELTDEDVI